MYTKQWRRTLTAPYETWTNSYTSALNSYCTYLDNHTQQAQ